MKFLFAIFLIIAHLTMNGQAKKRQLTELINQTDPAWPELQKWFKEANNKVRVISVDSAIAKEGLLQAQVSTHSILGSIIYDTGGLIIDDGWLRILGSPDLNLNRSIVDWNKQFNSERDFVVSGYLLIADDAAGGFFALNSGGLGSELGKVFYLSADGLEWENLELNYGEFLQFCLKGDLNDFYQGVRWKNWKKDLVNLKSDAVFTFYPFLWTKEGRDVNKVIRSIIPVKEAFQHKMRILKGISKD